MIVDKDVLEPYVGNFSLYGSIFTWTGVKDSEPTLHGESFDWWRLQTMSFTRGMEIGLLALKKREMLIGELECHRETEEILIPIDGDFVASVCACDREPKSTIPVAEVKAFVLKRGQCMVLKPGIWHVVPFPLKGESSVILIFGKDTVEKDLEFLPIEKGYTIRFQPQ